MNPPHEFQNAIAEIAAVADLFPGVIIIHNAQTDSVEYMSERGLRDLGTSLDELRRLGPAYHTRFFNAEDAARYVPKIFALLKANDADQSISFFQQVRLAQTGAFVWHSSAIRIMQRDEHGLPLLLLTFSSPIDAASHVTVKVQRMLDESSFIQEHHREFARLTRRELEVLRLLALGHSAPDIAQTLNISVQTAETHRRNLRQKLQAGSGFELAQYARAFDLI